MLKAIILSIFNKYFVYSLTQLNLVLQQDIAFFIAMNYRSYFHYCLLPLASCLLPTPIN
ncbi:hypothetical protein [Moorena producens]|uniref:hypothetical protein n=1 Tax=Moorena producens TaxID=1155739 RepID=UPI001313E39D|nr:hypothetical protein [Moorena producens]